MGTIDLAARAVGTATRDVDVVIGGAGPAGLTAGLLLRKAGLSVAFVEAHGKDAVRPNVIQLHDPVLGILDEAGFSPFLKGAWPGQPDLVGHFHSIRSIEQAGRRAGMAEGIPFEWDAAVTGVKQLADGVDVSVKNANTGATHAIHGKYFINATGGRIGIEQSLGAELVQASDRNRYLIIPEATQPTGATFEGVRPQLGNGTFAPREAALQQPDRGAARVNGTITDAQGVEHKHPFFLLQNPRDGAALVTPEPRWTLDLSDDELLARIRTSEIDNGSGELLHVDHGEPVLVQHRHFIAPSARNGRVLSVGDGVGRVHPKTFWGTGAGVEDGKRAANAILAAEHHPEGADAVLEEYGAETLNRHADWVRHSIERYAGGLEKARTNYPEGVALLERHATPGIDPRRLPDDADTLPLSTLAGAEAFAHGH